MTATTPLPPRLEGHQRAESHGGGAPRWCAAGLIAALGVAVAGPACSGSSAEEPGIEAAAAEGGSAAALQELIEAYVPVPLEATSDKHDAALARQREVMERLARANPALGKAALAAFRAGEGQREDLRRALLEIAATCDPAGSAEPLAHMVVTYDSKLGLGLRTHAAELLARTSPARALEVIGPLLESDGPRATLPPREVLVRAWAEAARRSGASDASLLADVATNLAEPPDARYAAIAELSTFGGPRTRQALEVVLFEGSSDSYLRRKAAQALQQLLPPSELCPLLQRAAGNESDEILLLFLADMMERACP